MSFVVGSFTLLEVGCTKQLSNFLIQNFKLGKLELPWMYEPVGEFSKIIKANKKGPKFSHEARPYIEYFVDQTQQESEASLKWEFGILDKVWMALEGIKKYRLWETRRQEFALDSKFITQLWDELKWGPNKIEYITKYRFEYTTKVKHVENKSYGELKYDQYWHAQYQQELLPKKGKPLPANFQGKVTQEDQPFMQWKKEMKEPKKRKLKEESNS